jgi:hypothetical protein
MLGSTELLVACIGLMWRKIRRVQQIFPFLCTLDVKEDVAKEESKPVLAGDLVGA